MRRLLLALLLVLAPTPAWAVIAFTEYGVGAGQSTGVNGVALTTTPSGALITCGIRVNTTGRTVAWTDDRGNTWVDGTSQVYNSSGDTFYTAYTLNATTLANAVTVTATVSGAPVFTRIACMSHSGIATASALDQINKNAGSGTVADGGAVTTTCANEVIVLYTSDAAGGGPATAGGGFTARGDDETDVDGADRIVSSTGTYTGTLTYGASGGWAGIAMAFSATTAPCGGTATRPRRAKGPF